MNTSTQDLSLGHSRPGVNYLKGPCRGLSSPSLQCACQDRPSLSHRHETTSIAFSPFPWAVKGALYRSLIILWSLFLRPVPTTIDKGKKRPHMDRQHLTAATDKKVFPLSHCSLKQHVFAYDAPTTAKKETKTPPLAPRPQTRVSHFCL